MVLWVTSCSSTSQGGSREYDRRMVDQGLLGRALQLDESARRELIVALQNSLGDGDMSSDVAAIID